MPNGTPPNTPGSNVIEGCSLYGPWAMNLKSAYERQIDEEAHHILHHVLEYVELEEMPQELKERIEQWQEVRAKVQSLPGVDHD